MSLLNQLFNRGVFGAKCKTSLSLGISRIKLLQNKRDMQLKNMRKEIAQFLQAGQEPIARIRVEHVIREQNIWAAYEILELFCEFVLARVPILESQKECPTELREAVASIIFAAPRCSDVPDLLQIKNLFATKYGKEFVISATELRPDSGVNRAIIEKLSVSAPSGEIRLKVLKGIAKEYSVEWDSSGTEAEFNKKYEDLLNFGRILLRVMDRVSGRFTRKPASIDKGFCYRLWIESAGDSQGNLLQLIKAGSKQVCVEAAISQAPSKQSSTISPNGENTILLTDAKQVSQQQQAPSHVSKSTLLTSSEIEPSVKNGTAGPVSDTKTETVPRSSDVLERARAAIASAERATAAARAAAELVNVKFGSLKVEGASS